VGFVVDKVALGQVFSRVFRFPLPIFIPPISPQSPSPVIRGWYNRLVVAAVPKAPPHKNLKNKKRIAFNVVLRLQNYYFQRDMPVACLVSSNLHVDTIDSVTPKSVL
jgi:hypothetical protein